MVGTKQKYEISYLLAAFLQVGEIYSGAELDKYIAQNVKSGLREKRGLSIDHLRRCMIDNGFLQRAPDGSKYWVAETFLGPDERERKEKEEITILIRDAHEGKANCPYCGRRFSTGVLLNHYDKKHSAKEYWGTRISEYFANV